MAFLWGGSKSLSELAGKFGWPSVCLSIILTPVLLLWTKLVAYPFWLMALVNHKPMYFQKITLFYPDFDNQWRERFYCSPTSPGRFPLGWNVYADVEGGKFFESFFGIIQVLDMDVANDDKFVLSSNFLSWFPASVFIEFSKPPVYQHSIRLYFPLDGPNKYNPFVWFTTTFVVAALKLCHWWAYVPLREELGVVCASTLFPEDENPDDLLPDRSFKEYQVAINPEAQKSNFEVGRYYKTDTASPSHVQVV